VVAFTEKLYINNGDAATAAKDSALYINNGDVATAAKDSALAHSALEPALRCSDG
jgi:hypothetical protein